MEVVQKLERFGMAWPYSKWSYQVIENVTQTLQEEIRFSYGHNVWLLGVHRMSSLCVQSFLFLSLLFLSSNFFNFHNFLYSIIIIIGNTAWYLNAYTFAEKNLFSSCLISRCLLLLNIYIVMLIIWISHLFPALMLCIYIYILVATCSTTNQRNFVTHGTRPDFFPSPHLPWNIVFWVIPRSTIGSKWGSMGSFCNVEKLIITASPPHKALVKGIQELHKP